VTRLLGRVRVLSHGPSSLTKKQEYDTMKTMVHYALAAGLAGALALGAATPSDAKSRNGRSVKADRVVTQTHYHGGHAGYARAGYANPVHAGAGLAAGAVGTGVGVAAGAVGAGLGIASGVAGAALSPFTGGVNYGYVPAADPYGAYAAAGPVNGAGAGAAYAASAGGGCWISTDSGRGYGYYGACGTRDADYGVAAISGQPGTQGTVLPY